MRVRFVLGLAAAAVILAALPSLPGSPGRLAAQDQGDSMMGSIAGGTNARAMTPGEIFADKLGLDLKTQVPQAQAILQAAAQEAAAPAGQLLQLRQAILNAEMKSQDAERQKAMDAYTAAAAQMAGIEASAMAKVVALLKPNQMAKIPQGFAALQGIFQSGAASGRGGAGGRRGRG